MTRHEFDREFAPMVKALNVKCNSAQADYFYHEFGKVDPRDFAHACRELAMGNPGFLPKLAFFRENVQAAREMRAEQEKAATKNRESRFMEWAPGKAVPTNDVGDGQYTRTFVDCCVARIKYGKEDRPAMKQFIQLKLQDDGYLAWTKTWQTKHGGSAYEWLTNL